MSKETLDIEEWAEMLEEERIETLAEIRSMLKEVLASSSKQPDLSKEVERVVSPRFKDIAKVVQDNRPVIDTELKDLVRLAIKAIERLENKKMPTELIPQRDKDGVLERVLIK